MSAPAPGRYCLAVCYCGDCDHYQPLPRNDAQLVEKPHKTRKTTPNVWADREESTWIDKL